MITLAEWKLIGIVFIAICYASLFIQLFIVKIVAKIKNKTKKCKRQQVTNTRQKKSEKVIYNAFIATNFKSTYLYENKNRVAELVRLVG